MSRAAKPWIRLVADVWQDAVWVGGPPWAPCVWVFLLCRGKLDALGGGELDPMTTVPAVVVERLRGALSEAQVTEALEWIRARGLLVSDDDGTERIARWDAHQIDTTAAARMRKHRSVTSRNVTQRHVTGRHVTIRTDVDVDGDMDRDTTACVCVPDHAPARDYAIEEQAAPAPASRPLTPRVESVQPYADTIAENPVATDGGRIVLAEIERLWPTVPAHYREAVALNLMCREHDVHWREDLRDAAASWDVTSSPHRLASYVARIRKLRQDRRIKAGSR